MELDESVDDALAAFAVEGIDAMVDEPGRLSVIFCFVSVTSRTNRLTPAFSIFTRENAGEWIWYFHIHKFAILDWSPVI